MNKNNHVLYTAVLIIGLFISGFVAHAEGGLSVSITDPMTGAVTGNATVNSEGGVTPVTTSTSTTLSTEATAAPAAPRSGSALRAGTDLLIDATIKKDTSSGDAFCKAVLSSFNNADASIRESYAWNKGSYSTNLDARSDLKGSQGKLYEDARKAYADTTAELELISPKGDDADYAQVAQLRAIVRSSLVEVATEMKKSGGPDHVRVTNLLSLASGAISCMPGKTTGDESNKAHVAKVQDAVVALNGSWDEEKGNFGGTATVKTDAETDTVLPYTESAKLFGIFSSHLTSKAVVKADGSVMIKRPWYRFLFSQKDGMTTEEVKAKIDENKLNMKTTTDVEARAEALEKLSNILNGKAEVETETTTEVK